MFIRELTLVFCLCTALAGSTLLAQEPAAAPTNTTVAPGATVADAPEVREALQLLDIWLEGQRLRDDLPGMAVGVVHDQDLIWSKGYGYADLAKKIHTTDQTLYHVASVTKLFTATAVTQLTERGELSLADPVAKHLPWFMPKDADPRHPVLDIEADCRLDDRGNAFTVEDIVKIVRNNRVKLLTTRAARWLRDLANVTGWGRLGMAMGVLQLAIDINVSPGAELADPIDVEHLRHALEQTFGKEIALVIDDAADGVLLEKVG